MTTNNISQKKLRMLCDRALRIYERHEQRYSAIASYKDSLVPAAQSFIEAYDAASLFQQKRNAEMETGRSAVNALYALVRMWMPRIGRDVAGFSPNQLQGNTDSPDQLIGDALRLIDSVETHKDSLPYGENLLTELQSAVDLAQKEWGDAQSALVEQQALQRQIRELGAVASGELVAFRQVLRVALGTSHRDYQALRRSRSKQASEESEVVIDSVETDAPAAQAQPLTNGHNSASAAEGASN